MDIEGIRSEIIQFLKSHGMYYGDINFEVESSKFAHHMDQGLQYKSNLKMIPTYIDLRNHYKMNEPVIAIDAGGTNFRRAVVTIKEDEVVVEDLEVYPMPGAKGEISKEHFFKEVVKYITPILNRSNKIGFCFSYPVEILPNSDGKVLSLTKEVKVKDIENTELGKTLLSYIVKAGYQENKDILVTNDTTAVLLSGISVSRKIQYDSFIGLILGTGTNTCYEEINKNILKNKRLVNKPGTTLINLESGGYGHMPRGVIDENLDHKTNNPGEQQFEKMISGAYQGELISETLKEAAKNGILSSTISPHLHDTPITSKDVSDFHHNPHSKNSILAQIIDQYGTDIDRIKIFFFVDCLIERAAKLLGINCKGILLKTDVGKNPCKPACLTVDGSTFYGSMSFQKKFDFYIKKHMENKGYYVKRNKVENGTLVGSAIGVLMKETHP